MNNPKPGDVVTCRYPVEAYYSNYGPNKGNYIMFKPGMIGIVHSIAPKVTILGIDDPRYDTKKDFLVVDFVDEQNIKQRVGLNYCNADIINNKTPA